MPCPRLDVKCFFHISSLSTTQRQIFFGFCEFSQFLISFCQNPFIAACLKPPRLAIFPKDHPPIADILPGLGPSIPPHLYINIIIADRPIPLARRRRRPSLLPFPASPARVHPCGTSMHIHHFCAYLFNPCFSKSPNIFRGYSHIQIPSHIFGIFYYWKPEIKPNVVYSPN